MPATLDDIAALLKEQIRLAKEAQIRLDRLTFAAAFTALGSQAFIGWGEAGIGSTKRYKFGQTASAEELFRNTQGHDVSVRVLVAAPSATAGSAAFITHSPEGLQQDGITLALDAVGDVTDPILVPPDGVVRGKGSVTDAVLLVQVADVIGYLRQLERRLRDTMTTEDKVREKQDRLRDQVRDIPAVEIGPLRPVVGRRGR